MSQSRERRMYLYWRSLKRNREYQHGMRKGWYSKPLMQVAVRFGVPIRVVRDVLEAQKGEKP